MRWDTPDFGLFCLTHYNQTGQWGSSSHCKISCPGVHHLWGFSWWLLDRRWRITKQTTNSVCNILLSLQIDIYLKVIQMQGNVRDNMKSTGKKNQSCGCWIRCKKTTKTNTFQRSWAICCKLNVRYKGKRTRKKLVQTKPTPSKGQQISEKDLQKDYLKL